MGNLLVTLAQLTQPNFVELARDRKKPQLVTIAYSHYVEFARWSLEYAGVPFDEHKYAPVQHVLPTIAARIPRGGNKKEALPTSTKTRTYRADGSIKDSNGATSVPVCILPDGEVLADSWSISKFSGLEQPSDELKKILDESLGPLTRQYEYSFILKKSNRPIWDELCTQGRGVLWRLLWWSYIGNMTTSMMAKFFQPNNAALVAKCREDLENTFKILNDMLQKSGGQYIAGDHLTAGDIAIASLAAVIVNPDMYCHGECRSVFAKLELRDEAFAKELIYWRGTPIGQYVMRIYSQHRQHPATTK